MVGVPDVKFPQAQVEKNEAVSCSDGIEPVTHRRPIQFNGVQNDVNAEHTGDSGYGVPVLLVLPMVVEAKTNSYGQLKFDVVEIDSLRGESLSENFHAELDAWVRHSLALNGFTDY